MNRVHFFFFWVGIIDQGNSTVSRTVCTLPCSDRPPKLVGGNWMDNKNSSRTSFHNIYHHVHPNISLVLEVWTSTSSSWSKETTRLSTVFLVLQSLLTGLMYYRPDDPIEYMESCLKKVRELGGTEKVRWDTFVGQEKKSLPPLNGGQSRRSFFRNGEQKKI